MKYFIYYNKCKDKTQELTKSII